MKKVILLFSLLLMLAVPSFAYDPLFEADLVNPPTDMGTVSAIFDCSNVAGSCIGRWKSVKIQASSSGTITHFLIPIAGSLGNAPVGFAVYADNGGEPADTPLARGYYASYSFGSGPGWYALPFTNPTTFSVVSGAYYHLTYLLDRESAHCSSDGVRGSNDCVPPQGEWVKRGSNCAGVSCSYDSPPGVNGEYWDLVYLNTSGPWEMGMLVAEDDTAGALSNTPLYADVDPIGNLFLVGAWDSSVYPEDKASEFTLEGGSIPGGIIWSGIREGHATSPTSAGKYAYFFSIEVYQSSTNIVKAFSLRFGIRPLYFVFGASTEGDSFWGAGDRWDQERTDENNPPLSASYDDISEVVRFSFAGLNPGQFSSWLILISDVYIPNLSSSFSVSGEAQDLPRDNIVQTSSGGGGGGGGGCFIGTATYECRRTR